MAIVAIVMAVVLVIAMSGGGDDVVAEPTPTPDAPSSSTPVSSTPDIPSTSTPIPAPSPTPTPPPNLPPELVPVGDVTAALGRTLRLQLVAEDPDGDAFMFGASPLPLLPNASLDSETGEFVFTPAADQIGEFEFSFTAFDGIGGTGRAPVKIIVSRPAPGSPTSLSGRVVDANDAVSGTDTSVIGATISLIGTALSTTTDSDGNFVLTDVPAGEQIFDIDLTSARTAADGSPYAGFREALTLIEGVDNVVDRPFFLPRIDVASLTQVIPSKMTEVVNRELGITLMVPPNTAKLADGSNFEGQLSISLVPAALAPAALPENLEPGLLITLQPVGVSYGEPVPITFPNIDGLPPGSEVDIWSLDPEAGTFVVVGKSRVSDDGKTLATVEGGIRANDWHTPVPPPPIVDI